MHRTSISHQLPAARMSLGQASVPRRPGGRRVTQDGRALRPGDRPTLIDALAGGPA
jgi:hypothetical protein